MAIKRTVHEQEDGTILAVAATGTSSKNSLLSWVHNFQKFLIKQLHLICIYIKLQLRFLEKDGNPKLAHIPILFMSKSPLGHVEPLVELDESKKEVEQSNTKVTIE